MNKNKQLIINMAAQVVAFLANLLISFFLTPFIVKNVGKEAYGFVGLANNFINYATIVTTALNSMASRFITISIHQEDYDNTNKYMASVVFANIVMAVPLTIIFTFIVIFLEKMIQVPLNILFDVKLLWGFLFLNFILSLLTNVFNVATFAKNRLELASLRKIESNLIKVVVLCIAFYFFKPSIWYLGFSTLLCGIFVIITNMYYTKTLLPFVEIKRKYVDFSKIKELVSSGIWNSISQISGILSTGLDLLIANIFVGAAAMGNVSLSKVLHVHIFSLFTTVSSVFAPQLTISYAKDDFDDIRKQLFSAIKLLGFFACIPIAFLYVYSGEFFKLWIPGENSMLLQTLSILTALAMPVSLSLEPLWNVFTVTNKVRQSSLCLIISSVISVAGTFILLNFTRDENLKLCVIVGFSTVVGFLRTVTFLPIMGAKYLKMPWHTFYPTMLKVLLSVGVATIVAIFVKSLFEINNWFELLLSVAIMSVIVCVINFFILLSKTEREILKSKIKGRLQKKGK